MDDLMDTVTSPIAEAVAPEPKKRNKWLRVVGGVVLLGAGCAVYAREFSQTATLAKQLTAEGWVVIGRKSCPFTVKQLEAFGLAQAHLKFIRSDDPANQEMVAQCGVEGVPHWHNTRTGESLRGYRKLASLQAEVNK